MRSGVFRPLQTCQAVIIHFFFNSDSMFDIPIDGKKMYVHVCVLCVVAERLACCRHVPTSRFFWLPSFQPKLLPIFCFFFFFILASFSRFLLNFHAVKNKKKNKNIEKMRIEFYDRNCLIRE